MIAIIDYGAGNLFNVAKALQYLGAEAKVTAKEKEILAAERVILPGVGAFGDCMHSLEARGLVPVLRRVIAMGKPFLGICVGLQLLFEGSEESPDVPGLGIFKGQVKRIHAPALKIPHMGWNSLQITKGTRTLFAHIPAEPYVYFVHSYAAVPADPSLIAARTCYGQWLTAAVMQDNVAAMQFHPEKSGAVGLTLLRNFLRYEEVFPC